MRAPLSLLTVCGLDELDYHSGKGVTHVLSILDPEWPEPDVFWAFDPHDRITLHFHDAIEPAPGIILPRVEDVMAILDFGQTVVGDPDHLLVHCHAGVSRSTAAMAMILAQTDPNRAEDDILAHVTRIRPQAWPNSRMVAFADELLGRNGRLLEAVAKVYAQRLTVIPDWAGLMTRCGRGREVEMARGLAPSKAG